MTTYRLHTTPSGIQMIYRVIDCAWIPPDEANTDYQEYLKWVAEGNVAEEFS